MFDGSYRSAKNISLGGSSSRLNRDSLLKKSQLEREKRERDRREREKAAIILSFWRNRTQWRLERDQLLAQLHDGLQKDPSTREFFRMLQIVHVTFKSLAIPTERIGLLERLGRHALDLQVMATPSNFEHHPREMVQFLALTFENFPNLECATAVIESALTLAEADSHLKRSLALAVAGSSFFTFAASRCVADPSLLTTSVKLVLYMLDCNLDARTYQPILFGAFLLKPFRELLSMRLASEQAVEFFAQLNGSAACLAPSEITESSLGGLLASVVDFATVLLNGKSSSGSLVSAALSSMYTIANKLMQCSSKDDADVGIHNLDCLLDGTLWRILATSVLESEGDAKSLELFCKLWLLVTSVMSCHTESREAIQRRVLAVPRGALLRRLWHHLSLFFDQLQSDAHLMSHKLVELVTQSQSSAYWEMWVFFSEIYTVCLYTMTEEEFFSPSSNPLDADKLMPNFSLAQHKVLATVLKGVVFSLYKNLSPSAARECLAYGSGISADSIRRTLGRLMCQLYKRDSAKSFTGEPGFWSMVSENEMDRLLSQLGQAFLQSAADDGTSGELSAKSMPLYVPLWQRRAAFFASFRSNQPSSMYVDGEAERWKLLLESVPFLVPFAFRVRLFRQLVYLDREKNNINEVVHQLRPAARVSIRRDHVFEDGYTYLSSLGPQLKGRIMIQFVDSMGLAEEGIDGGGVFKEFLTCVSNEAFDPNRGLFAATADQRFYPSPQQYAKEEEQCSHLRFLGKIVGKALYDGVLLNVTFAPFFLAKWLGQRSFVDDLQTLDPDLYSGLNSLKSYTGNVSDLNLTFTIDEREFGVTRAVDLLPNGASIPVTRENRLRYIYLCANYKLNVQLETQCSAFFEGLRDLIEPSWLKFLSAAELSVLLSGVTQEVDFEDLKRNTVYGGGYSADHPVIASLWHVLDSFSSEDKRLFLKFVTSSERAPLLGFGQLNPHFGIQQVLDATRLPTSSTCINLLKLPSYANEQLLADKLRYAIHAQAGFDLS